MVCLAGPSDVPRLLLLLLQGLKKSYDYKKVLKALKKGEPGTSVCPPSAAWARLRNPLLPDPSPCLVLLLQSSAATAQSLMTLS